MARVRSAEQAKRELATFAKRERRRRLAGVVERERGELAAVSTSCRRDKAKAKQRAAELRAKRRALVDACRTARLEGRERVRAARDALAAFRAEQRSAPPATTRATKRTAAEALAESDDEVRANIDPGLWPVFQRVKRSIRGDARRSRTEAFEHWCEANPGEVQLILDEAAQADVDRWVVEYESTG